MMEARIIDNSIEISHYPFNRFFFKKRIIQDNEINFIKLNTDIVSICINSNEIIFIPIIYSEQINQFAKRFNLVLSDKVDVWELICFPYVDTNRTEEELSQNMKALNDLSFTEQELGQIRKKIKGFIKWWVAFSMEFVSITHYDVLLARRNIYFFNPFYKRFYWYTMRVALKGFGIN